MLSASPPPGGNGLPIYPALGTATHGGTPEQSRPVLTVDCVPRLDPPVAPDELAQWLDGRLDVPRRQPALHDELFVVPTGWPNGDGGEVARRRHRRGVHLDITLGESWPRCDRELEVLSDLISLFVRVCGAPPGARTHTGTLLRGIAVSVAVTR